MKPTFYVDLDRTLFHTDRVGEIFDSIEQLYPDNQQIKEGYKQRHAYYVVTHQTGGDDSSYYHDLVTQLCDAELDCEDVFLKLVSQVGDGRFEYPGAEELISTMQARGDVKILTYGEDTYQRFKVSLCPSLAGLAIATIIEPKVEYLNTHATVGDWIVDDKQLSGVKPGVRVVRIQHDANVPADVHSLAEVTALVTKEVPSTEA